jgi:hypothetical protein
MERLPMATEDSRKLAEQRRREQNDAIKDKYPDAFQKMAVILVTHFVEFRETSKDNKSLVGYRANKPGWVYTPPDVTAKLPKKIRLEDRALLTQAVYCAFVDQMTANGFEITMSTGTQYKGFDRKTAEFLNGTPYTEFIIINL